MFDASWCRLSYRMQLDDRSRKLRSVVSWDAAGRSWQEAEVSRVVGCSWTIIAGSWCRLKLVNRYPSFDSTLG